MEGFPFASSRMGVSPWGPLLPWAGHWIGQGKGFIPPPSTFCACLHLFPPVPTCLRVRTRNGISLNDLWHVGVVAPPPPFRCFCFQPELRSLCATCCCQCRIPQKKNNYLTTTCWVTQKRTKLGRRGNLGKK